MVALCRSPVVPYNTISPSHQNQMLQGCPLCGLCTLCCNWATIPFSHTPIVTHFVCCGCTRQGLLWVLLRNLSWLLLVVSLMGGAAISLAVCSFPFYHSYSVSKGRSCSLCCHLRFPATRIVGMVGGLIYPHFPRAGITLEWCQSQLRLPGWMGRAHSASKVDGEYLCWLLQMTRYLSQGWEGMVPTSTFLRVICRSCPSGTHSQTSQ